MRILDRYLLREFLVPLLYSMFGFTMLILVFDMFARLGRFLAAGAPMPAIARYYFHFLFAINGSASFVTAILTISLLLAALYTCTRLIRQNELVAMMACGVSTGRILAPFFGVGLAVSALTLAAQEWVGPASFRALKNMEYEVIQRGEPIPETRRFFYYNAAADRIWDIHAFASTNARALGYLTVTQRQPDGTETVYTTVQANWLDGAWWLRAPRITRKNKDGAVVGEPLFIPRRDVEMREWTESPHDLTIENMAESHDSLEALTARDLRAYLRNHPDFSTAKRARLLTDLHARLAIPFTALVVVLLGVPVGIKSGRFNVMSRVFLALGSFFLFFTLLQVSLFLGKRLWLPPLAAAWLPNLIFGAIGVRFCRALQ